MGFSEIQLFADEGRESDGLTCNLGKAGTAPAILVAFKELRTEAWPVEIQLESLGLRFQA
jgi:hypothetical protein